jgi:hypothetical protein
MYVSNINITYRSLFHNRYISILSTHCSNTVVVYGTKTVYLFCSGCPILAVAFWHFSSSYPVLAGLSFFSLMVFGETEVPIISIFLCRPSEDSLSEVPSQMAAHLRTGSRLGRLVDSNPGLPFYNLVSLPMSHHCSLMSHHCSLNEPPLLTFREQ